MGLTLLVSVKLRHMDLVKLRAWRFHRQGLDGGFAGLTPSQILESSGWSRSVGGANPYLALRSRGGFSRQEVDEAVHGLHIHELPSARGCTYVVPKSHFGTALVVGQGFGDEAAIAVATRHLGVTSEEIDRLGDKVCSALAQGPLDPRQMKTVLGDSVRSFGEEGKKRGVTTDLPLALGRLQSRGIIRRISLSGRIDTQRYAYELWSPSPLASGSWTKDDAIRTFAEHYFRWTGGATVKNFQWMSGLGVRAAQEVVFSLGLVPLTTGSELLATPADAESFKSFDAPGTPCYALVGSIDNLTHLTLGLTDTIDEADKNVSVPGDKGLVNVGGISELTSHGIFDRGRLIGVWEYDSEAQQLLWKVWVDRTPELEAKVRETEAFIQAELEDARTFSLDSPQSRRQRLDALRN